MEKVLMPKLGMAQSYCVIERWYKEEGDKVNKGDLLVEVSTDKISYEIEAKTSGYLIKKIGKEKDEIPANEVIALIGEKDEKIPEFFITGTVDAGEGQAVKSGKMEYDYSARITALAKKLIEKNNLDPSKIKGTGPMGRILKEDVLKFMETGKAEVAGERKDFYTAISVDKKGPDFYNMDVKINRKMPLSSIRKAISEKMVYSKQNIPHISQNTKVDVTELLKVKEKMQLAYKELSIIDFILKAAAMAIRANLEINSSLVDDVFIIYEDINIGIVTSIPDGLIIPVIHGCDKLTILQIAERRRDLTEKAQQNKLSLDDIKDGTFTVTNTGIYNIRSCTAIIYPPQAAILTIGSIYSSPEVVDANKIEVRKVMEFSSTEDHRILDGEVGARFLNKLMELLQNPELIKS